MASKARKRLGYSDKDTLFVGRFVYDVVSYTLKKCGFPESQIQPSNCKENVYNRDDFLKVAGASALRVSLIMRDKWREMYAARSSFPEFDSNDIQDFLGRLVLCTPLSRVRITQSTVEVFLAAMNEVVLYFHHENIDFDLNMVIKYISSYIVYVIGPHKNMQETIEMLFDEFENITGYTKWITTCIKKFALPYGARHDVSDLFFERVKKQFKDELKRTGCSGTPSIKKLNYILGFLPNDRIEAMAVEESYHYLKGLGSLAISDLQDASESSKPPMTPECSEKEDIEGGEAFEGQLSDVSEPSEAKELVESCHLKSLGSSTISGFLDDSESSKPPMTPECSEKEDIEGGEAFEGQFSDVSEPSEAKELVESCPYLKSLGSSTRSDFLDDSESSKPPIPEYSEKEDIEGGDVSEGQFSDTSEPPEDAALEQDNKDSSELGIEHALGNMSLSPESYSQESGGVIPKQKSKKKRKKNKN